MDHRSDPPEAAARRHRVTDLLRLVDDLRRIAYDTSLSDGDAMRRVRDRFLTYDRPEGSAS